MRVLLQGGFLLKNFKWYNCHVCGVILILMAPVGARPGFFACITGVDVLIKVSIPEWADSGVCVQHDPDSVQDSYEEQEFWID